MCGATVRLRRKKPQPAPAAADDDRPWQRQSAAAELEFDDEAHHRQLNEALESGPGTLMDSLECLATERCALDSLSRFAAESLSPSSARGGDPAAAAAATPPAQRQNGGVSSDRLRKRTYRIGLNLFNKYAYTRPPIVQSSVVFFCFTRYEPFTHCAALVKALLVFLPAPQQRAAQRTCERKFSRTPR